MNTPISANETHNSSIEFPELINYDNCLEPVFKLDFNGDLLYANRTAIDFLRQLGGMASEKSIYHIISRYPEVLQPNCYTDINFQIENIDFHFSVIAFPEGGYVGLYGYKTTVNSQSGTKAA